MSVSGVHINFDIYIDVWNPNCNKINNIHNNNNSKGNKAAIFTRTIFNFQFVASFFYFIFFVNDELIFLVFHRNQIESETKNDKNKKKSIKFEICFSLQFIYSAINTMLATE